MSVRTRKRGKTYSYMFDAGKDGEGKRQIVERSGFATRNDAYDAGVAAYTDWKHGNIGITTPDVTLSAFLNNWMENACKASVKESTWQTYKSMIDNNIKPKVGGVKLQELTPAILDLWIQKMALAGKAYKSIALNLAILRRALGYAVYPGQLIQSNPAAYIKVPRNAPKKLIKRTIVTPRKMQELMEAFPLGHYARIPTLILYHTGMRIGEVVGLTWEDIDFEDGTISVEKQVRYIKRSFHFTTPKTEAGNRIVYIDPVLIRELQEWKEMQETKEEESGRKWRRVYLVHSKDDELISQSAIYPPPDGKLVRMICTRADGSMLNPDVLRWQLRQHGVNSHSFRHTQATVLIENGATPKGVASRLGQSSVIIAQDLYAHDTPKLKKQTANIFYESGVLSNDGKP